MASEPEQKIADVKAGHSAEATSRPVIVSNRAMVKDTTVKDDDEKPTKKEDTLIKSEAKPIQPVTKDLQTTALQTETEPAVEDDVKSSPADEEHKTGLNAEEKARQKEIAELAASGKYVVPIGHIERNQRLRKILSVVVLVLLLGLAVAWIFMKVKK